MSSSFGYVPQIEGCRRAGSVPAGDFDSVRMHSNQAHTGCCKQLVFMRSFRPGGPIAKRSPVDRLKDTSVVHAGLHVVAVLHPNSRLQSYLVINTFAFHAVREH